MKTITITFPYYDAPKMLEEHLKFWRHYPWPITENYRAVIVDDGSPNYPAIDVLRGNALPDFPVELYRIHEDIPWNHGGARNLALKQIKSGWVLMTDIDHLFPVHAATNLLHEKLDENVIYYPERYQKLGEFQHDPIKRHIGSFVMTRDMFWQIGGFDEDFSGYWNGPGRPFRKAVQRQRCEDLRGVFFIRYGNDMIEDASVNMGREKSQYDITSNPSLSAKQRQSIKNYHPKNHLRFTWERVL